ncbi:unnamed protein product [Sphagnum troendelagicum]|uniref:Uncharacterized protein n=1 Tax=Sphagnum troendelagicum TaxID=128251 RepID=A0ABP0UWF2_9BRYO
MSPDASMAGCNGCLDGEPWRFDCGPNGISRQRIAFVVIGAEVWTYELLNKKDVTYDLAGQKQVWLLELQVDETGERIYSAGGIGQQRVCNLKDYQQEIVRVGIECLSMDIKQLEVCCRPILLSNGDHSGTTGRCLTPQTTEKTIFSDKMIHEQAAEVAWRQFRNKEAGGNADNTLMLQSGRTEDRGNVTKPSLLGVASDQCNVD